MAAKKIGISRDLIIHPGETIADVLEERGITQSELASSAGVSPAYVSNVIAGKERDICKLCQRIRVCNRSTKVFLAESSGEL